MTAFASDRLYLGFDDRARAASPYAPFFNPDMAPLPASVQEALLTGALAHELLPAVAAAGDLLEPGYLPVETGYTITPEGAAHIAVLTPMPGVAPAMWDWWFAWHGSDTERYKLWHPRAHLHVAWADGREDLSHYVGRVSHVVEYVGGLPYRAAIRFVRPRELGLDEDRLRAQGETAICARIGMVIQGLPVETGWLVHHIRPVPGGAEMRSRFWLGGRYVRLFGIGGALGRWLARLANRLQPVQPHQVTELMVHDAQEMQHLAAILPQLHARFGAPTR